jgi:hypothetical protein
MSFIIRDQEVKVRVKSQWNVKGKTRSYSELGGAIAFVLWRIAQTGVLNLENEGFETESNSQRLDIIAEFLAFLVHMVDRSTAERLSPEDRQALITALAGRLANTMQDNRVDVQGPGDYRASLIDLLNARGADYAEFSAVEGEPGFALRRYFGEKVTTVMGPRDRKWVSDQVMDVEVPEAMKPLKKVLRDFFPVAEH